jgi:hypothetical protein
MKNWLKAILVVILDVAKEIVISKGTQKPPTPPVDKP